MRSSRFQGQSNRRSRWKNLHWLMWKAKEKGGAVTHAKKKDHVPDGGAFNCCHYFYSNWQGHVVFPFLQEIVYYNISSSKLKAQNKQFILKTLLCRSPQEIVCVIATKNTASVAPCLWYVLQWNLESRQISSLHWRPLQLRNDSWPETKIICPGKVVGKEFQTGKTTQQELELI